jgi:hypothetical protein
MLVPSFSCVHSCGKFCVNNDEIVEDTPSEGHVVKRSQVIAMMSESVSFKRVMQ